jgi:hypothetical protein
VVGVLGVLAIDPEHTVQRDSVEPFRHLDSLPIPRLIASLGAGHNVNVSGNLQNKQLRGSLAHVSQVSIKLSVSLHF